LRRPDRQEMGAETSPAVSQLSVGRGIRTDYFLSIGTPAGSPWGCEDAAGSAWS
jgi:hypothetical protein